MKLNQEQKEDLKMYFSAIVIALIFTTIQIIFWELNH
jgi:hypothetical protein